MNFKIISLSFLGLLALAGCYEKTTKDGDKINCSAVSIPALIIEVFDKETGLPLVCGVTVSVQDGDFMQEQSMKSGDDCVLNISDPFSLAFEREGKYDITVIKEGYIDWYQYDTVVSSNICHVNTIKVQAYIDK